MNNKGKILVVDDHQTVVKLMEAVLRLRHYEVIHAENGEQGLSLALQEQPALIFLDVMMPGMDGFTVCERLKTDPQTSRIPVVFLTARGEETDVERGEKAGGDGFVKKPFKTMEILKLIENHLQE
ncbi:MAG TPA: response regulator [Desulfuromonadales bacterium]|nr:response regulator [Desulfuromonadales bacterium]